MPSYMPNCLADNIHVIPMYSEISIDTHQLHYITLDHFTI